MAQVYVLNVDPATSTLRQPVRPCHVDPAPARQAVFTSMSQSPRLHWLQRASWRLETGHRRDESHDGESRGRLLWARACCTANSSTVYYLVHMKPDLIYVVGYLNHFMQRTHTKANGSAKEGPSLRRDTTDYDCLYRQGWDLKQEEAKPVELMVTLQETGIHSSVETDEYIF
jgi:hypothetical protein